jgi:PilZ domain-containing protein
VSVEKFFKERAVKIAVNGSYSLPNFRDREGKPRTFACRTTRVSPFRMMVDVPVVGKLGDSLTSYFPDFGSFDGSISDVGDGSFLIDLEMTQEMRERFADKLAWLAKRQADPGLTEARKDARFIPPNSHSTLTLANGSIHSCFVIDVSVSGVAISAEQHPPVGTPLAVGSCIGRVVRHFHNGFAVKFVAHYKVTDLGRLISGDSAPGRKLRASDPAREPA